MSMAEHSITPHFPGGQPSKYYTRLLNFSDQMSTSALNQIWRKAWIGPIDNCMSTASHWTYEQIIVLTDTQMSPGCPKGHKERCTAIQTS